MKKILFATTALVATAGMAAADVSFGGYGRFGIIYQYNDATDTDGTNIESRFRLNIDATAESDNGLSFNARVRMQADDNGAFTDTAGAAVLNGANFGVTAGGLNVQVGNVSGAIDSQAGLFNHSLGLSGLGYSNLAVNTERYGYFNFHDYESAAAGDNGVRVAYGMGNFNFIVSHQEGNPGFDYETGVSAAFTYNNYVFSLGWQGSDDDTRDKVVFIAQGDFGIADVTFQAAKNDDIMKYVLGADFEVGAATTVSAFIADEEEKGATGGTSFGLGMNHDLGGGTSIRGGVVQQEDDDVIADLGLFFNF